tara:strand:- start:849 stop:1970 length:1122 start_codon:yes stop_codon:yes gene_type:complete
LEKTVAAFGEFKADDRVAGAELLQKDAAKRRRLERAAAEEAAGAAEEAGAGEESDEDAEDDASLGSDDDAEDASDSDGGELLSDDDDEDDDEDEEDGEEDDDEEEEEVSVSGSDGDFDVDPEEEDEYGRVLDPKTGLKRKYIQPALTLAQKRDMATRAVAEAEARGEAAPKVRKNGILSLSELKRRAKAAAKTRRAAEAAEAEENAVVSDSEEDLVEHTRVLDPEDFRRIKALQTKGKLDDAMDKSGARKAKETAAEEMRRMLRLADRSTVADRRVNPDALMAVGLRKAHDKETRVASIMAGREDRGEFGSSQERKNKKTGGTTNVEKKKRKNMPLAARVMAAGRRRRGGAKFGAAKAVKDKQFKGKFRKGAN